MTVEHLLALIQTDDRAELIEGEIVYKAAPSSEHGFSSVRISQLLAPFDRKGRVSGGPGGWWIGADIHVIYEGRPNGFLHDLVGWRRDRHAEKPQGRRVTSKPDWVCAIISTNRSNDIITKRLVLHEHRVEFYWLVDIDAQMLSVLNWSDKGYVIIAEAKAGQTVRLEPFSEIECDVSVLLGHDPV